MKRHIKTSCLLLTALLFVSVAPSAMAADGQDGVAPGMGTGQDDWQKDMLEWANMQPKMYDEDGNDIPISGTSYFLENGFPTSSRGSRVLNACGSGYTQEGSGTHSYLLVATGDAYYPNATKRQEIKDEFDDPIWATDTSVFGSISTNMIDICIYNFGDGAGGVGGYFAGGDNIYVDSADINGWGYQIMAHEFQHLIHSQKDWNEDTWLNEGNSDLAIVLCYGGQATGVLSHIAAFEAFPGKSLTDWTQQGHDYGSSLSYITYIWEHFGGNATITHLVANSQNSISSVTSTLSAKGYSETGTEAFYRWTVANIVDDTSFDNGKWGYDEIDVEMNSDKIAVYPASGSGSSESWAADYVTFTKSGTDVQDLKITFNGEGSSLRAYVAMMGRGGTENKVERMTLDGAMDGTYTVEQFGNFGNYDKVFLIGSTASGSASFTYNAELIDKVPPITTLEISPETPNGLDGWYSSKPTITLTSNEQGVTIFYKFDSGADNTYSGPFQVPDGEHTIYYHAVDTSSNIEIERGYDVKVDSVNPVTTIEVTPAVPDGEDGWYVTTPTVRFTASEAGTTYYKWEGDIDFTEFSGSNMEVPDGETELIYYTADLHGNVEKEKTWTFKVDTEYPVTDVYLTPQNATGQDGWYIAPPTVTLLPPEDATAYYYWDMEGEQEVMSDILARDGEHTLFFYSKDAAGNKETLRSLDLKVDTTIPVSAFSISPEDPDGEDGWYVTTPTILLELIEDFEASIYYKFGEDGEYVLYEEPIEVPDGAWTFYWYAIDAAGNTEGEAAKEVLVDTVPPEMTLVVDPDLGENEWFTALPKLDFEVSEEEATIYYHWDYDMATRHTGTLIIPEGRHVLYYYAVDPAGNSGTELNREFRVDTQPPTAILNGDTLTEVGKSVQFDGSASKDTNEVVSYFFDFGDTEDSGWISNPTTTHSFKKKGEYTVTLKVKDKAGLESKPYSIQVKVQEKSGGGGGLWPDDPDDGGDGPFYTKTVNLAGTEFPIWLLLLLLLLIISIIVIAAVAARRRGRRKREERARQIEEDIDNRWRPRNDDEFQAYEEDDRALRFTDPYEFGYSSYAADDGQVEAVQMAEPARPRPHHRTTTAPTAFVPVKETTDTSAEPEEPVVKVWTPAAATSVEAPEPAPEPKPEPKPEPAPAPVEPSPTEEMVKETAPPPPPSPKAAEKAPEAEPGPKKQEKREIDLDSEIDDLMSRLNEL